FPYPPRRGMDVIYFNLLKLQSQQHNVVMVTLRRKGDEDLFLDKVRPYCNEIHVVGPVRKTFVYKSYQYAKYGFCSLLFWRPKCTFYDTPHDLIALVERLTSSRAFDVVEIHHSPSSGLADYVRSGARVLYMYDIHFRSRRRLAATERGFRRLLANMESS